MYTMHGAIMADIFGGVHSDEHDDREWKRIDITRGVWHTIVASLFGPFSYFFIIGEKNIDK